MYKKAISQKNYYLVFIWKLAFTLFIPLTLALSRKGRGGFRVDNI